MKKDVLVLLTSGLTLTIQEWTSTIRVNTKVIFRAFMLLYFGGFLFGNSKSWARLELIGPLAILENKTYTIDFGSAILGHLYYYLDQTSKQEYHCYEYCQIGHHILIDDRLDDFYPMMLA
ncbi:hypothetical protein GIB67_028347 [Kingdonia uniflora]|uniref:Uncharacterized protein n=1 Tax=Kingdonia uniflora TaxID=39325 RepID=A0A7J7MHR3_9MAGN|nr:hypothetical protein GIB67_028347 [Kingdonia uniflora]